MNVANTSGFFLARAFTIVTCKIQESVEVGLRHVVQHTSDSSRMRDQTESDLPARYLDMFQGSSAQNSDSQILYWKELERLKRICGKAELKVLR